MKLKKIISTSLAAITIFSAGDALLQASQNQPNIVEAAKRKKKSTKKTKKSNKKTAKKAKKIKKTKKAKKPLTEKQLKKLWSNVSAIIPKKNMTIKSDESNPTITQKLEKGVMYVPTYCYGDEFDDDNTGGAYTLINENNNYYIQFISEYGYDDASESSLTATCYININDVIPVTNNMSTKYSKFSKNISKLRNKSAHFKVIKDTTIFIDKSHKETPSDLPPIKEDVGNMMQEINPHSYTTSKKVKKGTTLYSRIKDLADSCFGGSNKYYSMDGIIEYKGKYYYLTTFAKHSNKVAYIPVNDVKLVYKK